MAHVSQAREAGAGHGWLAHFHPLSLRVQGEERPLSRRLVLSAFALMAAGLIVTLVPVHADTAVLGDVADPGSSSGYVPALCFLVGDLCLAAGVWVAMTAARDRPLERKVLAGLGIVSAALTGHCVRLVLQIVVLRKFYRPALFFSSASRAAAVGWGGLLAIVLLAGFLAPLLVSAANLLPRVLADAVRPTRWLARRRWWLLLPFGALAVAVVITQWVLPGPLADAMGYRYPTPSGAWATMSLRDLSPAAWNSLQIVSVLPLLLLMWEGTEAARTCQRLVRTPKGGETALLAGVRRIDYRLAGGAAIIGVTCFAVATGSGLSALAGVGLLLVTVLSSTGVLGRAARLAQGFERGVSKWQLPEEWRDLGRVSLLLAVLVFPVLIVLCGDIAFSMKDGLWFPSDLSGFYYYWHDYGLVHIPSMTAGAIYGHVDAVVWGATLGLSAIVLLGMLIQGFSKDVRGGFGVIGFLLRVGLFAVALAPVARLADHSYATFILAGCAVLVIMATSRSAARPAAVWSAIIIGGALTLWSLALWHTTWLPTAAVLCLTIVQRFVYNAGNLNDPDKYRPNRVAYFQAISLLSVAMLALGHGAASGYFGSEGLSAVSDHVALSVVAAIWLVMLVARQTPTTPAPGTTPRQGGRRASADVAATEPPRSWARLLEPGRALVRFTGRGDELTALLAWCEDDRAETLRLITGPGGIGKTRLAMELATRLVERGWEATWAGHGQEAAAIEEARDPGRGRVLLIVDNAETRAGLTPMLSALASGQDARVRVLLLARYAGAWLDQLTTGSPALANQVRLARQAQLPLATAVTTGTPDHTIVSQAAGSIGRNFGLRESRVQTRYKTTAGRRLILDLHAAALVATLTDAGLAEIGTGTVQADIRTSGLGQLLRHERQFWYDSARAHGLIDGQDETSTRPLRQIIAASCLLGATSVTEACDLAARIPGASPPARVTAWLEEVSAASHHAPDQAAFISPAPLAELHTVTELTSSPKFAQAATTGLSARQALHAVAFLARAVPDYTEATPLLSQILTGITQRITGLQSPAGTLTAVLNVLPYPRPALAAIAATVTRELLDQLPAQTDPAARAYWLTHLRLRLAETGDLAGAVTAAQEAVIIWRELGAAAPDRYLPDLAAALDSAAAQLASTGDHGNALLAAEEAAAIHRGLAAASPGLYGLPLALSVTRLAARYREAGRSARSLEALQEAVAAYRELAAANPVQYRAGLAQALGDLGLRYHEQGHASRSLPAAEEAVELYRELATANPARYRPGLASTLNNLGLYLVQAGRAGDALPFTQEAVALYRRLADTNPGQYRANLTRTQTNLRVCRQQLKTASTP